jgi:hypothetical protein
VQLGDVVDRGARSRDCLELLMRLEKEAQKAGGRVHALIGNHEAFNMIGYLDYVSPEEFASYVDGSSLERRERGLAAFVETERRKAAANGAVAPGEAELRRTFEAKVPLGYFEHRQAWIPSGRYGRWVLSHNAAVRINGIVFSHGDWTETVAAMGLLSVNDAVRDELSGRKAFEGGLVLNAEGPLQHRGLSKQPLTPGEPSIPEDEVDRILAHLGARRLVVAHSVTGGFIEPRYGGKHVSVDTGMLEIYGGGHRVALEIVGDTLRALHPQGKVELPARLDASTLPQYLEAVASVDPQNETVLTLLSAQPTAAGSDERAVKNP